MIVDVNDYILNLLVMDITGFQLLFPSVQFGEPFVEYSSKFLRRISGICIFIVLIGVFYPDINHFRHRNVDDIFSIFQAVVAIFITSGTVGVSTPVSYTHLDVYKRQGLHYPLITKDVSRSYRQSLSKGRIYLQAKKCPTVS